METQNRYLGSLILSSEIKSCLKLGQIGRNKKIILLSKNSSRGHQRLSYHIILKVKEKTP